MYQNNGLTYRKVDEHGNMRGVPIKASSIYGKPTLKFLEDRFKANEVAARPFKARVKNAIDLALLKKSAMDLTNLVKVLEKQGITTLLRQNADGLLYGITYVDHQTKCVFNGSTLGKPYSPKAGKAKRTGSSTAKLRAYSSFPD